MFRSAHVITFCYVSSSAVRFRVRFSFQFPAFPWAPASLSFTMQIKLHVGSYLLFIVGRVMVNTFLGNYCNYSYAQIISDE